MNLRLELPNPHRKLKPEMYATIRVHSLPEPGVLMVPEAASSGSGTVGSSLFSVTPAPPRRETFGSARATGTP